MGKITIVKLTQIHLTQAVNLVLRSNLDSREEIEHHLKHVDAHFVALDKDKVIGVIGWYQDNVNYANEAMGDSFPGEQAYWVGFFAVDKAYRNQGIGYALLQKLEKTVKTYGADMLWVSSVPDTKDYYVRQGFKVLMSGKINGDTKYFCVKKLKI